MVLEGWFTIDSKVPFAVCLFVFRRDGEANSGANGTLSGLKVNEVIDVVE